MALKDLFDRSELVQELRDRALTVDQIQYSFSLRKFGDICQCALEAKRLLVVVLVAENRVWHVRTRMELEIRPFFLSKVVDPADQSAQVNQGHTLWAHQCDHWLEQAVWTSVLVTVESQYDFKIDWQQVVRVCQTLDVVSNFVLFQIYHDVVVPIHAFGVHFRFLGFRVFFSFLLFLAPSLGPFFPSLRVFTFQLVGSVPYLFLLLNLELLLLFDDSLFDHHILELLLLFHLLE